MYVFWCEHKYKHLRTNFIWFFVLNISNYLKFRMLCSTDQQMYSNSNRKRGNIKFPIVSLKCSQSGHSDVSYFTSIWNGTLISNLRRMLFRYCQIVQLEGHRICTHKPFSMNVSVHKHGFFVYGWTQVISLVLERVTFTVDLQNCGLLHHLIFSSSSTR